VGLTLIKIALALITIAMPLAIVSMFHGTFADVGWYSGLAAALEIPFMLIWARLGRRFTKEAILAVNAILYGTYIVSASYAPSVLALYWLLPINSIATAAILSFQISYLQDMIKGRMGLSTSLYDIVSVVSVLAASSIFGYTTSGGDYRTCLLLAASCTIAGAFVVFASRPKIQLSNA